MWLWNVVVACSVPVASTENEKQPFVLHVNSVKGDANTASPQDGRRSALKRHFHSESSRKKLLITLRTIHSWRLNMCLRLKNTTHASSTVGADRGNHCSTGGFWGEEFFRFFGYLQICMEHTSKVLSKISRYPKWVEFWGSTMYIESQIDRLCIVLTHYIYLDVLCIVAAEYI